MIPVPTSPLSAVPATSKCAYGKLWVNSFRNIAARLEPPLGLLTELAISANLDLSKSLKSWWNGKRQTNSPALLAAVEIMFHSSS